MTLEEILQEYQKKYQLDKLQFDDDQICHLIINDSLFLALENSIDGHGFFHYTTVGTISSRSEKEIGLEALSGNLFGKETGKASLGYDPNTEMIVLFEYFHNTVVFKDYDLQLKRFVKIAEYWIEKLQELQKEPLSKVSLEKHVETLDDYEKMQLFFA